MPPGEKDAEAARKVTMNGHLKHIEKLTFLSFSFFPSFSSFFSPFPRLPTFLSPCSSHQCVLGTDISFHFLLLLLTGRSRSFHKQKVPMPVTSGYRQCNCPALSGIPCGKKSVVNICLLTSQKLLTVQTGWRLPRAEDCLAGALVLRQPQTTQLAVWPKNTGKAQPAGDLIPAVITRRSFGANPTPLLWS